MKTSNYLILNFNKKIYFINNWGESTDSLIKRYSRQTPNNKGVWGDLKVTNDFKLADYYIVLEGSNIATPIDRTIFIKREPEYISKSKELPYKHIIDFTTNNSGVTYWLNKTYDELTNLKYPNKTKEISCIASNKHNHRLNYIKKLFNDENNIELYGIGHTKKTFGDNYKGVLNYDGNCKYEGLIDYKHTIVIENSSQKNYWTEKLADALLCWCHPIYWGCPNLNEYFPEGCYSTIDITSSTPNKDIDDIINTPLTNEQIELIGEAREAILNKFNIWEIINNKIKNM
jgi:hypothetical protein